MHDFDTKYQNFIYAVMTNNKPSETILYWIFGMFVAFSGLFLTAFKFLN
jgi:hypothetical protein